MLSEARRYQEARIILGELIGTSNEDYARLELGKLEYKCGNVKLAKKYFFSEKIVSSMIFLNAGSTAAS